MFFRPLLVLAIILTACLSAGAQTKDVDPLPAKPSSAKSAEKTPPKNAREIEAERLLKERRANAQSLLMSLADYEKAVQLARGLNRDAPRSVATIAIARTVLETKKK